MTKSKSVDVPVAQVHEITGSLYEAAAALAASPAPCSCGRSVDDVLYNGHADDCAAIGPPLSFIINPLTD